MSQKFSVQSPRVSELNLRSKGWESQMMKKQKAQICRCFFGRWRSPDFIEIAETLRRDNKMFRCIYLIHLHCHCGCGNSDTGIKEMSHRFKELGALKSFCFEMGGAKYHKKMTTGWWHLSEGLKRFSSLKRLVLNFYDCDVNDENLKMLGKGLRRDISLKDLCLVFTGHPEIRAIGINHLGRGLKNLIFLQSLCLDFSQCESITDQGLVSLKNCMKKLKNLQEVDCRLEDCPKISLYGVEQIAEGFKDLPSLKSILLKISGDWYSMKISQCWLGKVILEQKIKRDFWQINAEFESHSLQELLNKLLMALQETDLEDVDDTEDSESKQLKRDLKILISVGRINLAFHYSCKMTGQKLKEIAQSLAGRTCLRHLQIEFGYLEEITDKGLQDLSESLGSLTLLKTIDISFSDCQQITDNGFSSLCENLKKLVSLENMKFSFSYLENVSDFGIKSLAESLNQLLALKEVTFEFYKSLKKCDNAPDLLIEALKENVTMQRASFDFGQSAPSLRMRKKQNQ